MVAENGRLRLGASLTYDEAMEAPLAEQLPALAEARVPSARRRSATAGRSAGTRDRLAGGRRASPALIEDAEVELAGVGGTRRLPSASSWSARSGTRAPRRTS